MTHRSSEMVYPTRLCKKLLYFHEFGVHAVRQVLDCKELACRY